MNPPETIVVNLRKEKCDFKACRNSKGEVAPIPQPGWLGNPYKEKEYGRTLCISLFRTYFQKRIKEDETFKTAVLALKGKRLGCFCKPKNCHVDIVKEWLDQQPSPCPS